MKYSLMGLYIVCVIVIVEEKKKRKSERMRKEKPLIKYDTLYTKYDSIYICIYMYLYES